jgi:hypothetical protein
MISIRKVFFILTLTLPFTSPCQTLSVVKDLKAEKLKFEESQYVRAEADEALQTSYFLIEALTYEGNYLQIDATRDFTLFVNGQLAASARRDGRYSIDSLRQQFGSPRLQIGLHFSGSTDNFNAKIVSLSAQGKDDGIEPRKGSSFRDFSVVAIFLLLTLFISLLQLNPKLTSEYFSLTKIFSLRETDDGQIYTRITSSSNILFYIFSSLMAGFSLTLIFEFTHGVDGKLTSGTFWLSFYEWIRISFIVLSFFFIKIVLVYSLSRLFGIKGAGRIHFFYWIRVLLVVASVLTIILFLYFISRGQNATMYQAVLWIITIVLSSIMVLVFLKLIRRSECSIFHLFSYICATEIIPFLITIKLLHQ